MPKIWLPSGRIPANHRSSPISSSSESLEESSSLSNLLAWSFLVSSKENSNKFENYWWIDTVTAERTMIFTVIKIDRTKSKRNSRQVEKCEFFWFLFCIFLQLRFLRIKMKPRNISSFLRMTTKSLVWAMWFLPLELSRKIELFKLLRRFLLGAFLVELDQRWSTERCIFLGERRIQERFAGFRSYI